MQPASQQAIPKIIHTCWFGGGKKSPKMIAFEEQRKKVLSDYEHLESTENNFDLSRFPFIEKCYKEKKYAHVSDMVRVIRLFETGGIYLDTDVQVLKSFTPLLGDQMFMGYMWACNLGTAVIGARPGHPIIGAIRAHYTDRPDVISTDVPNNDLFTRYFIDNVEGFRLNGQPWRGKDVAIYSNTTFEHPSFLNHENYTIHYFSASWKNESRKKRIVKDIITTPPLGLYLYRKYICKKSIGLSPFVGEYRKATGN